MSRAPRAQFTPTVNGFAWAMDTQNASMVWPDSVRPLRSVTVTEIINGRRTPFSSNTSSIATMAAFALRVSTIVSSNNRSHPPSMSPRTCSLNATHSPSNVMFLAAGLFTSGEIDRMRLVGPIEPATKRGLSGVRWVYSCAAERAIFAASRFSS